MNQLNARQMKLVFGGEEVVEEPIIIEDPIPEPAKKVVKFKAGSELSNTIQ